MSFAPENTSDIRTVVREKYGLIAEGKPGCCGAAATAESAAATKARTAKREMQTFCPPCASETATLTATVVFPSDGAALVTRIRL